jgi:hypothetical protein
VVKGREGRRGVMRDGKGGWRQRRQVVVRVGGRRTMVVERGHLGQTHTVVIGRSRFPNLNFNSLHVSVKIYCRFEIYNENLTTCHRKRRIFAINANSKNPPNVMSRAVLPQIKPSKLDTLGNSLHTAYF